MGKSGYPVLLPVERSEVTGLSDWPAAPASPSMLKATPPSRWACPGRELTDEGE